MKKYGNIFGLSIFLLFSFMPITALAEGRTKSTSATLACGNAALITRTTYLVRPDVLSDQVLSQRLIWRNIKTNQEKELNIDGEYVIKHVPDERKVLDAAIQMLVCEKSTQGQYYFYVFYYCTDDEERGFCASGKVEFGRYLREDGAPLIKGPRRQRVTRREAHIIKSFGLGLYGKSNVISLKSVL